MIAAVINVTEVLKIVFLKKGVHNQYLKQYQTVLLSAWPVIFITIKYN